MCIRDSGLNTNLVRKWRSGRGAKLAGTAITPAAPSQAETAPLGATPEFVAIEMPAPAKAATRAAEPMASSPTAEALIHVELRRGALQLNVRWPSAAAEDCRAWLGELSSSLLK